MLANVKPLPDYVKRLTNPDVARGEVIGGYQIWPTARPAVALESGERLAIALRIRPVGPDSGNLKLGPGTPDSWKLRQESDKTFWLDLRIDPVSQSISHTIPVIVDLSDGRSRELRVQLAVNIPTENLVLTPREIDFGEMTLADAKSVFKRLGVRKLVGAFRIKSVSSTLPFLRLEQVTMVEGSNYLIKVSIDPAKPVRSGPYEGVIVIETDEGRRVQAPVRIKLIAR